eukprot:CAMPEP_0197522960 /NCGR_PEP_ID=MMETSP1318-20131121/7995_1 /TAXON_ID=552666 /ORGANISM="Partenskyella glossopodia, Strain RCC365" /LENGTH=398 /DNA_ID=CAMNT_0043075497 /DNA_START=54 /DNA_END=1247 /DNA_ORIENTATION=-
MHGVKKQQGEQGVPSIRDTLTERHLKLGSELYNKLDSLVESDPDIDELGFLVLEKKSPEFILEQHKLGISFWCIPLIYSYTNKLFAAVLKSADISGTIGASATKALHSTTRCLVLINPDNHTCWNVRKILIQQGSVSMESELKLLSLVFTKHPKSGIAWSHRRWILRQIEPFRPIGTNASRKSIYQHPAFQVEMSLCEYNAGHNKNNYYAWTHRLWVFEHTSQDQHAIAAELKWIRDWNSMHVSEHSGFHYKHHVLLKILRCFGGKYKNVPNCLTDFVEKLDESNSTATGQLSENDAKLQPKHEHGKFDPIQIFETDIKDNEAMIKLYPGFESLWMHRRFLFTIYIRMNAIDREKQALVEIFMPLLRSQLDFVKHSCLNLLTHDLKNQRRHAAAFKMW